MNISQRLSSRPKQPYPLSAAYALGIAEDYGKAMRRTSSRERQTKSKLPASAARSLVSLRELESMSGDGRPKTQLGDDIENRRQRQASLNRSKANCRGGCSPRDQSP